MSNPKILDEIMPKEDVLRYSPVEESAEDESFIPFAPHRYRPQHTSERRWRFFYSKTHILALYALNLLLLALVIWGFVRPVPDPTLGVYSPANSAVKYIAKKKLRPALFKPTEYMGYPTPDGRTDELWSSLYNFGVSKISASEAAQLDSPTLAIPGTNEYLIQLDVWHELHCLNDLRKLLYPEAYGSLQSMTFPNGTIDREQPMFRHWDHCVDMLRQTLMCHADVSPIPFHINTPQNTAIIPRLETTHTCRDFDAIRAWAVEHAAGEWDFNVNPDKVDEIIAASGFDQSNEEEALEGYEA